MSPAPAAPSSASHSACSTQSPSEWPSRPRVVRHRHAAQHERAARAPAGARRSRCPRGSAHARPSCDEARSAQARSSGVVSLRLRGGARDAGDRLPEALDRHALVGDGDARRANARLVGAREHVAAEALRRLRRRQAVAVERSPSRARRARLHGVGERDGRDGRAVLARGRRHRLDQVGRSTKGRAASWTSDDARRSRRAARRSPASTESWRRPPPATTHAAWDGRVEQRRAPRRARPPGRPRRSAPTEGAASQRAGRRGRAASARRRPGRPWAGPRPCARRAPLRPGWPRSP